VGLRNQLYLNIGIWETILERLPLFSEARGSAFSALDAYMIAPLATEWIVWNDISVLWQRARTVDAICERNRIGAIPQAIRDKDAEIVRRLIKDEMIPRATHVMESVGRALAALTPLAF
jgi:hypothetical protein